MKHVVVKGTQHGLDFTFRGVRYHLTGRFGYYRGEIVAEAAGPNGEITWSNEDGDFCVCPADEYYPAHTVPIRNIFNYPVPAA